MKKIFVISILFIFIPISVFARYHANINESTVSATIAEPIIRLEELSEKVISEFYKNTVKEYRFKIKNYTESDNHKRISEVDFYYNIVVNLSDSSFPVKYELYNSNNEEILRGNSQTDNIIIKKESCYEEEYRLVVYWEEKENMASGAEVNIEINVLQCEEIK